jgi:hypothetical protein
MHLKLLENKNKSNLKLVDGKKIKIRTEISKIETKNCTKT